MLILLLHEVAITGHIEEGHESTDGLRVGSQVLKRQLRYDDQSLFVLIGMHKQNCFSQKSKITKALFAGKVFGGLCRYEFDEVVQQFVHSVEREGVI